VSENLNPEVRDPGEGMGNGFGTEDEVRAPFTFKLAIALTVLYLAWRLIQGIVWVFERIGG
jgi:hypothetical protein